tara:strand:+ start:927 stop:1625 length:699 start_codon:yes stop_codon:yes gene_type:complete
MSKYKSILKYFIEFVVIVSGITASFWVEEYRESLQNIEEKFKVLNSLKIELDEIDLFCQERKIAFKKDSDIISYLISSEKNLYDSIEKLVETPFEIEVAIIDYRGFQPPMNRYNSIINEGTLKFVDSDSIKQLLGRLNNTLISYLNANVGDEKIIQQKISSYIIENYPEIIMSENNTTLKNYYNILREKINNDLNLKAYLKTKSRTMYVKNIFLDRYVETLVILRKEIERKL